MRIAKIVLSVMVVGLLCGTWAMAQEAAPAATTSASGCKLAPADKVAGRPSRPANTEVKLNGKDVRIDYSQPKMEDPKTHEKRKVMGALVPYGEPWRLGANEATALHTETDLDIGGTTVPAGNYTLFAVPEADKWTLIVHKKTCEWGIPYPGQADELARIPMKVAPTAGMVDPFTITLKSKGGKAATLTAAWENTQASVDVKAK